eukprot:maker-scaffold275_size226830-snap-gene-1.28 protein:Tk00640 transcript:maker-scaffold275_size226830-snap-gene-1.28-mRNA-1 annotation:"dna-directed rna omega subunit family protein"
MVHYSSAISYYQSTLPLMNRTIRSSSVERSSHVGSSMSSANQRFMRASTVGPSSIYDSPDYFGVMPFNRSLHSIEDRMRTRAASLEPVNTYRRAYHSTTPYGASTTFDYKVFDYANRLDQEETTRKYINSLTSNYHSRNYDTSGYSSSYRASSPDNYSSSYNNYRRTPARELEQFRLNSRDLYAYKHYRKSNQTLNDRNTRASSPLQSRELDRYYKTERRSSYLGDISSGGHRDFRYYNFRSVPYYGGSDYYTYVNKMVRSLKGDVYTVPRW